MQARTCCSNGPFLSPTFPLPRPWVAFLLLGLLVTAFPSWGAETPGWASCSTNPPAYGLYLLGDSPDERVPAALLLRNQEPSFFDPQRPTLVFIHGLQLENDLSGGTWDVQPTPVIPSGRYFGRYPGASVDASRSFYFHRLRNDTETPYNLALLDWKAFGQSGVDGEKLAQGVPLEVLRWAVALGDAESLIWDDAPGSLTAKRCLCSSEGCLLVPAATAAQTSLAHMVRDELRVLNDLYAAHQTEPRVEIVAHSLGTHLAVRALDLLAAADGDDALPDALLLLDPGFGWRSEARMDRFVEILLRRRMEPVRQDRSRDWFSPWGWSWSWQPRGLVTKTRVELYKVMVPGSDWWQDGYRRLSRSLVDYWLDKDGCAVNDAGCQVGSHVKLVEWTFQHLREPILPCAIAHTSDVLHYLPPARSETSGCWEQCVIEEGRPDACSGRLQANLPGVEIRHLPTVDGDAHRDQR